MAAPERFAESQICSCTAGTVHTWPRLCEKSLGCYDFFKLAGGGDGCQALWKGLTGAKAHFSQPCWTTTWPRTIWFVRLTLSLKVLISPTLAEMDHARDSDRLGFSPIRTLVSTGGTQSGYVFSMPVYKRGSLHDTIEERRRDLTGFVHGSLITGKMVDTIIAANKTPKGLYSFFFLPGGGHGRGTGLCS